MSEQQDMPLTQALWALRGPGQEGRTLGEVLAGVGMPERRERDPDPPDPDEHAANLLARGYAPGAASQLAQRLGDTLGELETVRAANEAARKRAARVRDMHTRGRSPRSTSPPWTSPSRTLPLRSGWSGAPSRCVASWRICPR